LIETLGFDSLNASSFASPYRSGLPVGLGNQSLPILSLSNILMAKSIWPIFLQRK
jgi:hypothetical protein